MKTIKNQPSHFFALLFMLVFTRAVIIKGTTYYIDSVSGNNHHTGQRPEQAWKSLDKLSQTIFASGDTIFFKAGGIWQGQFRPQGSGNSEAPIVVDMYGKGNKPFIDGNGIVNHVMLLDDLDYWEVNNLEITNNSKSEGSRIGVFITASSGLHKHIHLKNLYIHNIMGRYTFEMEGKNTGGIGIIGNGSARFDDILIENCEISNIVRVGIFTNGNTGTRGNRPITNLVVRNNVIHHCVGDGAIIRYASRPLIEHNIAFENHNGPQEKVKWGIALWCRSTDEAVFQFNEVYNTRGDMDGTAFDSDLDSWRTVVQYNYSHNNEGGFMVVCGSSSEAIVRFNISQNDGSLGNHIFDFPDWGSPRGSGIFHNNTIYIPKGSNASIADEALSTTKFYNNLIYNKGNGSLVIKSSEQTAVFLNNSLYGYSIIDSEIDSNAIIIDPMLVDPGTGGKGMDSIDGYKLKSNSPCIGKGITKNDMKGIYWLPDLGERDYWGNPINIKSIDIGAFQTRVNNN